ncbi:DUF1592 domain-containing protein [Seonamhaeicola marinus]|uniref:DUF1592 domain-containing protein n=1 Tax=Seonamhaeicola marinus TaxID=1912246 RepID=A0A5D0HWZ5_9FLAO|nr:DUF1592 domain-containing protein [Seonamhaeicola marinus]TYA74657.1 DUF1592 domain-containing protein [Seonamhaeicola marinus]
MRLTLSIAVVFTFILASLLMFPLNEGTTSDLIAYFGNFHPLVLHVPIGALIGVLVLEVVSLVSPKLNLENAGKVLLWFTAISFIPAAVFGFFLASSGGYNEETLAYHKWLGWITAFICVWLLVYRLWAFSKSKLHIQIYRGLLLLNVIVLSLAGHYGGTLTHGSGYLTKDMPKNMKAFFGIKESENDAIISEIKKLAKSETYSNALMFADSIHPIMDKNCFECHNNDKQKGDLRLDNIGWKFSNIDDVKKWQSVYTEIEEGNMPPEEKEPLSTADRERILKWINTSLNEINPELEKEVALIEEKEEAEELAIVSQFENTHKLSGEGLNYVNNIKPIINKYCVSCHGPKKQKGSVRLDRLNWDMVNGHDAERWHAALDMINSGEMPPKKKPQLSNHERRLVVDWITTGLDKAVKAKEGQTKTTIRRLTKAQYTNTLSQLLHLPINFGDVLPDDGKSKMGFTNNGDVLQMSTLHIDYYQKIAREALDKAIVKGDKPVSKKYKVTFGKNIGVNAPSAEFGGFQSAPVQSDNFIVDVIDENGKNIDTTDAIKKMIGIGMRGSASDRYSIEDDGMVLYSALPHKDVPPRSWQGPSPNLKVLIKNNYPRTGPFALRVKASKGHAIALREGLIELREDTPAKETENMMHLTALNATYGNKNLVEKDSLLMPVKVDGFSTANIDIIIPKDGFYQIDLVHPYVPTEDMPSFILRIGKFNKIQERLQLDESLKEREEIVTPVSLAYLRKGKYKTFLGGKFFVGFKELRVTPLQEGQSTLTEELKAEAEKNEKKYAHLTPSIRTFVATRTDDGMDYRTFDVNKEVTNESGSLKTYAFYGHLENLPVPVYDPGENTLLSNTLMVGLWNDHLVKKKGENGPPLKVKSVELEVPYYPVWPPKSHTSIFFESDNKTNEELYATEVLRSFIERAYRRPLAEGELGKYVNFWKDTRWNFDSFEESIKEVLVAVLCSPNFLYMLEPELVTPEVKADEFLLASKMAYFLWNSPPDDKLLELSSQGQLKANIGNEIERMVGHPKIKKMIEAFSYEWLRVDRLENMTANAKLYPDFTRFVKEDMASETYNFIHYVLQENMSIMNFIDSDFAMLNQNLAEFYGIKDVKGTRFRPVAINRDKNRGGLLSQGAFLTGHSDGVQAHPIKRAVWIKEKILGDPPPPPPPNVPELDPETPGFEKLTLKEQLELHRNKASCVDCHLKIDPYGVAFENYDAVGRYITETKGKAIDSKSKLPDGSEVDGIQGIKEYILSLKRDDFTRSVVEHLYAYALGRDVNFADDKEIDRIVEEVKKNDYKFQSVLKHIILSKSFSKHLDYGKIVASKP